MYLELINFMFMFLDSVLCKGASDFSIMFFFPKILFLQDYVIQLLHRYTFYSRKLYLVGIIMRIYFYVI